ncbi:hypothetical protein BU16DRAFT_527542 [Lophium mytilinum]|uniref:ribonuclease H n=1 Tax=Lophium mytilinum TaxID=390894 RepID=A0A6A6QQI2_9PEZI|nr:hypothetical protein BU16DRAFT_527542 [Lophium mytilinum]
MNVHTLNERGDGVDSTEHPLIIGYNAALQDIPGLNTAPRAPPLSGIPLTTAEVFRPSAEADTPITLFTHHASEHTIRYCHPGAHRLVRRFVTDPREILIYTSGSCFDQRDATESPKLIAGCAFVYKPPPYPKTSCQFRLENRGPTEVHPLTKRRAELRAALGALAFRKWSGEGWLKVVIATDSNYVVFGATEKIEDWAEEGWKTEADSPVEDVDLWKMLLAEINTLAGNGVEVAFWRIPRELNLADSPAKEAEMGEERTEYSMVIGVGV